MYIFDFDGTLVDTRAAVIAAYSEAGIDKTPEQWDEVWGQTWAAWTTEKTHQKKNRVLHKHLHLIKPLPLLSIALAIKAPVITSASAQGVALTLGHLMKFRVDIANLKVVLCEVNWKQKSHYLSWAAEENDMDLVYVDDSPHIREKMNGVAKRWKAISPDECLASLLSSSQQEKTPDSKVS